MKRADVLRWMFTAGAQGDTELFTRLYCENRISREVADAKFREGARFGEFVRKRDSAKAPTPPGGSNETL